MDRQDEQAGEAALICARFFAHERIHFMKNYSVSYCLCLLPVLRLLPAVINLFFEDGRPP